jgi:GxxExxY protein
LSAELNRISGAVIGAAIEVHRVLGPGFLESVYEEALCEEFGLRQITFVRQARVDVRYKGRTIGQTRLDLVVEGAVVVELKAVDALIPVHTAQVLSYPKMRGLPLGLLINFNVTRLTAGVKRVILTEGSAS